MIPDPWWAKRSLAQTEAERQARQQDHAKARAFQAKLNHDQALEIVLDAAALWAEEIRAYIEPAEPGPDHRWDERAQRIEQAITLLREGL